MTAGITSLAKRSIDATVRSWGIDAIWNIPRKYPSPTSPWQACHGDVGLGYFLGMFQIASMPHDLTVASMERFAREVMPAVMALEGSGRWEPNAEAVPTQAAE